MSKLTATLWIHENKCRVILREVTDTTTVILSVNDTWNNRASAELDVMITGPVFSKDLHFISPLLTNTIDSLNKEFEDYVQKETKVTE